MLIFNAPTNQSVKNKRSHTDFHRHNITHGLVSLMFQNMSCVTSTLCFQTFQLYHLVWYCWCPLFVRSMSKTILAFQVSTHPRLVMMSLLRILLKQIMSSSTFIVYDFPRSVFMFVFLYEFIFFKIVTYGLFYVMTFHNSFHCLRVVLFHICVLRFHVCASMLFVVFMGSQEENGVNIGITWR